jgi:ATP-dependent helicase/nuclease subunit B
LAAVPTKLVTTLYGLPALEALRAAVLDAKQGDALAPVTVVVPTNSVGVVARRHLARPHGIAAVGFFTVYRLAELLAAPSLAAEGRRPVSNLVVEGALRRCLLAQPGLFEPVQHHPATTASLLAVHHELRDLPASSLDELAEGGSRRTREVVRLHRAAVEALAPAWHDEADLLQRATRLVLEAPARLGPLGHLVVHLPQDVGQRALGLLRAAGEHTATTVVLGLTGSDAADAGPRRFAAGLGLSVQRVRPVLSTELEVVTASDADEEVRAAVRRLVASARGAAVPLDRMAVLYPAPQPYGRLLAEHLDAAGITWNGKAARPLHDRVAGRTLLALLDLGPGGARRSDVFALLGGGPIRAVDGRPAPVGRWERVSREAGVVGGGDDWRDRLATLAANAEADADRLEADPERARHATWRRRDAATARELAAMVELLLGVFPAAGQPSTWAALGGRALTGLRRLLGGDAARRSWPVAEVRAAEQVEALLDRLAHLDSVDPAPDVARFRAAVAAELDNDLGKRGRLGEGVHVGPLSSALGLDVDLLVVVGMAEGTLPTRTTDDSLVPDSERAVLSDELAPSTHRAIVQARHLYAAVAAAKCAVLVHPRGDLRRSGPLVPSRWLRALVGLHTGHPVTLDEWRLLHGDWFTHVHSFAFGVRTNPFPATEQEHRLRRLDHHVRAGGRLDDVPLDGPLSAGLRLVRARASNDFTAFDGNLAGAGLVPFTHQPLSASRIETWLSCPHRYLLQYLLGVEPVENPEEQVRISALEQGSLVHEVLEQLVRRRGEMAFGEPWSPADHALADALVDEVANEFEQRGVVGRPIYWRGDRARLRRDLHAALRRDSAARAATGRRPLHAELAFGFAQGLPAAEIHTPSGRVVRLRGRVDRVDVDAAGTAYVVDYKTGKGESYKGIGPGAPFGRDNGHIQLAIYAQVARLVSPNAPAVVAEYVFVSANRAQDSVALPVDASVDARLAGLLDAVATEVDAGVFPAHPAPPVWQWRVPCDYCDPDGLGTAAVHRDWERKRQHPAVQRYAELVDDAAPTDELADD